MREAKPKQPSPNLSSEGQIARRPNLFRALGADDPPLVIELEGRRYQRVAVLKHDSWAATAVYLDGQGRRVACKFNRINRLFLFPMAWLGRRLARREQSVLQLMQGTPGFPHWPGPVFVDGKRVTNAVAHDWIEGRTFKPWIPVDAQFFPQLQAMIAALHAHNIAYVDMSKWENILVGDDGRPYLIDYQVHVRLSPRWPQKLWLRRLQAADLYYLHRHWLRAQPDQVPPEERERWVRQPIHVRVVENLGAPWRAFRRLVLRLFGVRGDPRRVAETRDPFALPVRNDIPSKASHEARIGSGPPGDQRAIA